MIGLIGIYLLIDFVEFKKRRNTVLGDKFGGRDPDMSAPHQRDGWHFQYDPGRLSL